MARIDFYKMNDTLKLQDLWLIEVMSCWLDHHHGPKWSIQTLNV